MPPQQQPARKAGNVGMQAGPVMPAADRGTLEITGKGGHGAHAYLTVDPVVVAAHIITAIQTIVSRNVPASPMHFSISASAKVAFRGDVFLHGYVVHPFAGEQGIRSNVNACARELSRFIARFGRLPGQGPLFPTLCGVCQI